MLSSDRCFIFFFFNDTATTEIYTLSLHDALPISHVELCELPTPVQPLAALSDRLWMKDDSRAAPLWGGNKPRKLEWLIRSEEHTSELQSRQYLVCRLLLEKKKKKLIPYQVRE